MEAILRSDILYKSPEFHQIIRQKLIVCTDCIIGKCNSNNFDACIDNCMKPCVEFKLDYESKRSKILESLKDKMLDECLNSVDQDSCKKKVINEHLGYMTNIFHSYK